MTLSVDTTLTDLRTGFTSGSFFVFRACLTFSALTTSKINQIYENRDITLACNVCGQKKDIIITELC